MSKLDPIIAVSDVEKSSAWYQAVFGWKSMHGGSEFEILTNHLDEVMLCLHQWEAHGHPTMEDQSIPPGNGLILYFRTENMEEIHRKVSSLDISLEEEIHLNENSLKREFSLRDPNGYYLTVTEYHEYKG